MTIIYPGGPNLARAVRPFQADDIFVRNPRIVRPSPDDASFRATSEGDIRVTSEGDFRITSEGGAGGADALLVWGKAGTFAQPEAVSSDVGPVLDADIDAGAPAPKEVNVAADWLSVDPEKWGDGLDFFIPPLEEQEKTKRILDAQAADSLLDPNEGIENVHFNLRLKPEED